MPIRTALLLVLIAVAGSALAQGKKAGPCTEDYKKFCANVTPGDGRIAKCMAGHHHELSPACQSAMKAAHDKIDRMAKACKPDMDKWCKGIRPGDGRILSCLKGRESDLSPACAGEFKRAHSDPAASN
jgi:cysteine rich repeat protein